MAAVAPVSAGPLGLHRASAMARVMARLSVLVPQCSNAGVPFNRERVLAFEAFLEEFSSGYTVEEVVGVWKHQRESLWRYTVVIAPGDAVDIGRSIESYVQREFDQDAVYVDQTDVQCTTF